LFQRATLKISKSDPLTIKLMFDGSECWLFEPDKGIRFELKVR
jgi:hypothetical protein